MAKYMYNLIEYTVNFMNLAITMSAQKLSHYSFKKFIIHS